MLNGFPKISVTLDRPGGSIVDHRWVPGSNASTIKAIPPQPANGVDKQFLPEGDRDYDHLKIWTRELLQNDDLLTVYGVQYKVVLVQDYETAVVGWPFSGFHRALIRRVQ